MQGQRPERLLLPIGVRRDVVKFREIARYSSFRLASQATSLGEGGSIARDARLPCETCGLLGRSSCRRRVAHVAYEDQHFAEIFISITNPRSSPPFHKVFRPPFFKKAAGHGAAPHIVHPQRKLRAALACLGGASFDYFFDSFFARSSDAIIHMTSRPQPMHTAQSAMLNTYPHTASTSMKSIT